MGLPEGFPETVTLFRTTTPEPTASGYAVASRVRPAKRVGSSYL